MYTPNKSKLNQDTISRYESAPHIRRVVDRLGGYDSLQKHPPYTGTTDQEYVDWLTTEAMIGYEAGQTDSPIPGRIRQHAANGIAYLKRLPIDWTCGNDKTMTIRQLVEKARWFASDARAKLEPCFNITTLEADPFGEYETAYSKYEYVYLGAINAAEEYIAKEIAAKNSPYHRRELKAALESVVCVEIIPILQSAIPLLEDMMNTLAPLRDAAIMPSADNIH